MSMEAWVLNAPIKVLREDAHPYRETTLATLGRHELGLCRSATSPERERSILHTCSGGSTILATAAGSARNTCRPD